MSRQMNNISVPNIMESVLFLVLILYPVIALIQGEFLGYTFIQWVSLYITSFATLLLLIVIFYRKYGKTDLRFKMFFHATIVAYSTYFSALGGIWAGMVEIFSPGFDVTDFFLKTILTALLPIVALLGGYISLFRILNTFEFTIDKTNSNVESGDLSSRIENQSIVNDTILGKSAGLINSMLSIIANIVRNVGKETQETAVEVEELVSATEEVTAAIEEVSSTSQSMSQAASQQAEMIAQSVEQMNELNNLVHSIVSQIEGNSDVITQIAHQTNILALNAGIEASRAGDYGRGFAVVAENVRRLSEETKTAAKKINQISGTIASSLSSGFDEIRMTVEDVAALSQETAASAEEVSAAAEEVGSSIGTIFENTTEISTRIDNTNEYISKYS